MTAVLWLAAMLAAAGLGWLTAEATGAQTLWESSTYQLIAAALLAIGLYGSTSGIRLPAARERFGAILFATTAGVLLKSVLIVTAMYYLIDPRLAIVGLAVAQIDPLAVAAMLRRSGMTDGAKAILQSWAAFDDPVTALLAVYAVAWLVSTDAVDGSDDSLFAYAGGLTANLLLVVGGCAAWLLLRWLRSRVERLPPRLAERWLIAVRILTALVLVALLGYAIAHFLMLGVAFLGLFYRPAGLDQVMRWVLTAALLIATFALGLLLVEGISLLQGAALAAFAFLAQMVAAALLPARLTGRDRIYLALGQQNGITAIILALALEPVLPGTVALVAPAVLVVNLLHLGANAWWDLPRRINPPPDPDRPAPVPR